MGRGGWPTDPALDRAEDAAGALGLHPAEVWPEYDEAVAADQAWREASVSRRNAARRRRRGSNREDGTAEVHEKDGVVG